MSDERMTDKAVTVWHAAMRNANPPADGSPVDCVLKDHLRARREEGQKGDRIHALEVQQADLIRQVKEKDATIKALADALGRHGFACRVANPADPCFCIGCETRAALRLAGWLP